MLFPKAPETEIEITKIIGYNYKVNVRALGGDLVSCFGNDDASPGQMWSAELAKESGPHLCAQTISWRGEEGAEDPEAARPSSLWLGGLWVRDIAESRVSVSNAGFPAPSGIISYLRQSCPLTHNSITVNSLRRRESSTAFLQRAGCGRPWQARAGRAALSLWGGSVPSARPPAPVRVSPAFSLHGQRRPSRDPPPSPWLGQALMLSPSEGHSATSPLVHDEDLSE